MKLYLPANTMLPPTFRYPEGYLRSIHQINQASPPDLFPWRFLGAKPDEIEFFITSLAKVYPAGLLIPFARFEDSANGDLACFDGKDATGNPRVYFHVYGYQKPMPAWEERYHFNNFDEWLQATQEESARRRKDHET